MFYGLYIHTGIYMNGLCLCMYAAWADKKKRKEVLPSLSSLRFMYFGATFY